MGLLDSVIGAMNPGPGGGPGGQAELLNMVLGVLGQGGQGAAAGGLGALVEQFQRGGLGDVVASWVSTGQNLPISADQLGGVLGADTVAGMASKLGMGKGDLLGQLSQMLPQVVDRLTPQGRLPEAGESPDLGQLAAGVLGGLLRR
jgi:uncharacterized protein YidB (DUF937 family)